MERQPVASSNIKSVGYDPAACVLEAEFANARFYQYFEVPAENYDGLIAAASKGSYFYTRIRGRFLVQEVTWERRVQDRINDFLELFPSAEYGAAHIILSDYNLEDRWFPQVIGELNRQKLEPDAYDPAEVEATLAFLKGLQAIPVAQRCPVRE